MKVILLCFLLLFFLLIKSETRLQNGFAKNPEGLTKQQILNTKQDFFQSFPDLMENLALEMNIQKRTELLSCFNKNTLLVLSTLNRIFQNKDEESLLPLLKNIRLRFSNATDPCFKVYEMFIQTLKFYDLTSENINQYLDSSVNVRNLSKQGTKEENVVLLGNITNTRSIANERQDMVDLIDNVVNRSFSSDRNINVPDEGREYWEKSAKAFSSLKDQYKEIEEQRNENMAASDETEEVLDYSPDPAPDLVYKVFEGLAGEVNYPSPKSLRTCLNPKSGRIILNFMLDLIGEVHDSGFERVYPTALAFEATIPEKAKRCISNSQDWKNLKLAYGIYETSLPDFYLRIARFGLGRNFMKLRMLARKVLISADMGDFETLGLNTGKLLKLVFNPLNHD